MSSIYANTGVDIDLIFFKGTGASMTNIIDDTGQDIGYKYSAGSADWDTGLVASSGQDIGRILGGEIAAVYVSKTCLSSKGYQRGETPDTSEPITAAWNEVSKFSSQKDSWTRCTGSISYTTARDTYGIVEQRYMAIAFHVVLNAVDASVDASLSSVSRGSGDNYLMHGYVYDSSYYSDDYGLRIVETRRPADNEVNFVVAGRSGYKRHCDWEWHNDWDYWDYDSSYVVYDSVSVNIAAKINSTTTRNLVVTLKI